MTELATSSISSSSRKQIWFLRSILLVSFSTVTLLFAYSFLFLTPSYVSFIENVSEQEAIQVAQHYMAHLDLPDRKEFSKQSLPKVFTEIQESAAKDLNVIKIKVFSPDGETIFSTANEDIGVFNTKDYFHNVVKTGKPYTKIVQKNTTSLEDQIVTVDVVETYVPVMDGDSFLGAFEIYLDITATKYKLDTLVFTANLLLLIISSGLLLAMIILVIKAKTNILARQMAEEKIRQQSISLLEKNSDLSIINSISDVINQSFDLKILLQKVLEQLANQLSSNNEVKGVISLLSDNKLHLENHFGYDEEFIKEHEKRNIDECLCGKVAKNGEIVFACGVQETAALTHCYAGEDRCHTLVPLKSQNEVVGILSLHTPSSMNLVDKKDMLHTIGNQIGLAISNVKLFMEAKKHALIDPLTGVGNRRKLDEHLTRFISEAKRHQTSLTLAMADIDHFKKYNDSYGHAKGDEALARVASILEKEIREIDFIARYGGEEFVILFSKTDSSRACLVAERIRARVEKNTDVTISMGIASLQPDRGQVELLKEADAALYQAKEKGRNRVETA